MSYNIDDLIRKMGKPGTTERRFTNTERDDMIVQLHDMGYSYRQIGDQLHMSGQAVFGAYHRALARYASESNT